MFDNKKVEFLDEEREKLWKRLTALEKEVKESSNPESNATKVRFF
jgi:hypothetical protein